jgi:uncharacterized peroxidase-related enzyme
MTLKLIVSDDCKACQRVQSLLESIKSDHPFLNVETVNINSCRNKRIFITPALFIEDELFSYGDIEKDQLIIKIKKYKMAFIKIIEENEASGKLKTAYEEIKSARGKLANIMKIHSLIPDSMTKHMDLYKTIMFGKSNLSRELKEMIAVVVSVANKCDYCINHHAEALNYYWKNKEKINRFVNNFRSVGLEPRIIVLLEYADELTVSPNKITQSAIDKIKSYGWNDEDILLTNLIVSYFNFVNRIALGLGVEFTEDEVIGYKY